MKRQILTKALISILLVAVLMIGGTIAYLVQGSNEVSNTLQVADPGTSVVEKGESSAENKTAQVKNTGNVPVYVRAIAVVVSAEGSPAVSAEDMTINYNGGAWSELQDDGYYYYLDILSVDETTAPLFTGVTNIKAPKDANFSIQVYQECVAVPTGSTSTNLADMQEAFNGVKN